jgi:hypothetical protein
MYVKDVDFAFPLFFLTFGSGFVHFYRPNVILCIVRGIIELVIPIMLLLWMEHAVVSDMYVLVI